MTPEDLKTLADFIGVPTSQFHMDTWEYLGQVWDKIDSNAGRASVELRRAYFNALNANDKPAAAKLLADAIKNKG